LHFYFQNKKIKKSRPEQEKPVPANSGLQVHVKLPGILVQMASL